MIVSDSVFDGTENTSSVGLHHQQRHESTASEDDKIRVLSQLVDTHHLNNVVVLPSTALVVIVVVFLIQLPHSSRIAIIELKRRRSTGIIYRCFYNDIPKQFLSLYSENKKYRLI